MEHGGTYSRPLLGFFISNRIHNVLFERATCVFVPYRGSLFLIKRIMVLRVEAIMHFRPLLGFFISNQS